MTLPATLPAAFPAVQPAAAWRRGDDDGVIEDLNIHFWGRADRPGDMVLSGSNLTEFGNPLYNVVKQAVVAKQFEFKADFGDGNGEAIEIHGTDDIMSSDNSFTTTTLTTWVVMSGTASVNGMLLEHGPSSAANGFFFFLRGGGGANNVESHMRKAAGQSIVEKVIAELFTASWNLVRQEYAGTQALHDVWVDGVEKNLTVQVAGEPGSLAGDALKLNIGSRADGTLPFAGHVREILIAEDPGAAIKLQVDAIIQSRWNTPALP